VAAAAKYNKEPIAMIQAVASFRDFPFFSNFNHPPISLPILIMTRAISCHKILKKHPAEADIIVGTTYITPASCCGKLRQFPQPPHYFDFFDLQIPFLAQSNLIPIRG